VRDWGPPFHDEDAAYFVGINRNKRSIGLDLASEGGRAVLMKMLESADVLIENFKPGTLDKWGIGNDVLRAKFPKLVHCRISGFGGDGPRGGNPGYDAIIQAMTGMIAATGSPQAARCGSAFRWSISRPGSMPRSASDGAVGAAAIRPRASSSRPRCTRPALPSCIRTPRIISCTGKRPALTGNEHPNLVPYAIFPTKTDNIFIGVGNDGTFRKLRKEIGKPSSAPIRALPATRTASPTATRCAPSSPPCSASTRPSRCCNRLLPPGLPAGPVQKIDQALTNRHTHHRGDIIAEGLVQGRRLADPAERSQAEPAPHAAEIQPAHRGGAGRVRLFHERDRGAGRQPARSAARSGSGTIPAFVCNCGHGRRSETVAFAYLTASQAARFPQ
jgi:crotonobetainyl-CoA:carnitine CoA-transferase CaiB-like acyl-CoA transferase